jgi:hypothetical protein
MPKRPKKTAPPTIVQAVAWELKDGVRGSLTNLSRATRISLDSLRVAKRPPNAVGARPLSRSRARMLALLLAAHRAGQLDELIEQASEIEGGWKINYPGGIAD